MKVFMLGWELPPYNSGGLGIASYGLAKALTEAGVSLDFLLPEKLSYGEMPFKIFFAGVSGGGVRGGAYTMVSFSLGKRKNQTLFADAFFSKVFEYAGKASEFAKTQEFDIIHAHDWLTGVAGVKVKEETGKPLLVHIHATELDRASLNPNPLIFSLEKEVMERADKVVAVSNYTKEIITEYYGISPEKVEVVHNGFTNDQRPTTNDWQKIPIFEGKKVVLFVGRITLQKGPDYLLEAAKRVLERRDDVLFVFAGAGDMQGQIIRQALELGIADKVIFAGFLRGEELEKAYRSAHLFVMPSVSEPFGLSALEASSYGVPVLLSRQAGVSEVLHHTLLVDFWDTEEMASKILSVLEYPEVQKELSKNSSREVTFMDWRNAAQKLLEIYEQLLFHSIKLNIKY